MKKDKLLRYLGVMFIIVVILSHVVGITTSDGSVKNYAFYLSDIVLLIKILMAYFIQYGILILAIGGFYGVVKATGAYDLLLDNISSISNKSNKNFVVLTLISVLSAVLSVFSVNPLIVLFLILPLFYDILKKMNFDKVIILNATLLSALIGLVCNFSMQEKIIAMLKITDKLIITKYYQVNIGISILMLIATIIYNYSVINNKDINLENIDLNVIEDKKESKKEVIVDKSKTLSKEKEKEVSKNSVKKTKTSKSTKKVKKNNAKKVNSKTMNAAINDDLIIVKNDKQFVLPLIIMLIITLVIVLAGTFNFHLFNIQPNLISNIINFEILKDFKLANLFGNMMTNGIGVFELGFWDEITIAIILFVITGIIAWLYSLKFDNLFTEFKKGVNDSSKIALYVILANVIFTAIYTIIQINQNHITFVNQLFNTYLPTANNVGTLMTNINIGIQSFFTSIIGGPLSYTIDTFIVTSMGSAYTGDIAVIAALIINFFINLGAFLLPTSPLLIAGLAKSETSVKEWLTNIYKLLLIFIIIFIVMISLIVKFKI